jgi:DDE superfamily endonuclease
VDAEASSTAYLFLQIEPEQDHAAYFSRKDRYGFNVQVVASADKRILWCSYGNTAACHDSTAWNYSPIHHEIAEKMLPNEYLLADKAYEIDRQS